jgi:hypothetical protein
MSEFGSQINDTSPEFFYRVTDRLQMESCLTALAKDSKSVVIYSQSSELLDYYGAAFVRRIKQKLSQSQVEIFMPRDTEAMLDRFNKLLNTLSLDVATASRLGASPEKVWVVYDANALGAHELQLLTRLIQQFPGTGVSIVLMFSSETTQNEDVTRPNKQFVSWGLDLPTSEQKLSAIQQARKNGQENLAVQFFAKLTKAAGNKASAPSTVAAVAAPRAPSAGKSKSASHPKKASAVLPWLVGILGLFAISLLMALWLNPDVWPKVIAQAEEAYYQVTGKKNPKAAEPKEEIITETATPKDEAGNAMPPANLNGEKPLSPDASNVSGVANAPSTEANAATNTATSPVANVPAVPAAPEPAPPPAKEPEEAKLITELPDVAVSGRQWLKKLPDDSFVLIHKSFKRVKEAQAFIRSKDYLVNARISPVYKDGKDEARFVVVTGHFRSKERASNTIARLGLPAEVAVVPTATAVSQSQLKKSKP